jgi:hypothetical protein
MLLPDQFSGIHGFGALAASEFEALRKAISSGYDVGGATQTGGGAWRLEFLENTMAILTHKMKHIVFWNDLPKPTAKSTAVEYSRRVTNGSESGGWHLEGQLPEGHDATYDRKVALVKYLGDVREITMPFLLSDTLVNQRQETTESGTMWLLRVLERSLFKGNAKLGVASAESVEIDGLETYISRDASASNRINLWGQPIEEGNIRNGGQVIVDAYGNATHVYMPSEVCEDFSQSYTRSQLISLPTPGGGLTAGMNVNKISTIAGEYDLRPLFLYKGLTREVPVVTAATNAPTPDPSVAITGFTVTTGGNWGNSLGLTDAGAGSSASVEYKVAYGNQYGESVAVVTAPTSQTIAFADLAKQVRLTVTNPVFSSAPTFFSVYRRDTNASGVQSAWGCVARIALASTAAGATQTWDDDGSDMPGTYRCWMGELTPDVLHASQLLPFTRIPLPALSLTERFALVVFVSFIMRQPNKWVEFRNVGRRTV